MVDSTWTTPGVLNVYPRLGGLYTIMSFSGSVGKLMVDSCLSEIPKHAFGGVDEMLSDKKIPSNVRTFSMLTEELLRNYICDVESWSWMRCRHTYQTEG